MTIACSHSIISASAGRRRRTPGCCSNGLPEQTTTFDVVTHSRGGLVLRNLVERASSSATSRAASSLVARCSSHRRTTARRWRHRNGGTTPSAGLRTCSNCFRTTRSRPARSSSPTAWSGWPIMHSGDLPGLQSMDGDGDHDRAIQGAARSARRRIFRACRQLSAESAPCSSACSMLASISFSRPPTIWWFRRREAGASIGRPPFIPASRIGCFGPGGNLPPDSVTHVNFFSAPRDGRFSRQRTARAAAAARPRRPAQESSRSPARCAARSRIAAVRPTGRPPAVAAGDRSVRPASGKMSRSRSL